MQEILLDHCNFTIFHAEDLAFLNTLPVNGAVARGKGDEAGAHMLRCFHHVDVVFLRTERFVEIEHCSHTLRNSARL